MERCAFTSTKSRPMPTRRSPTPTTSRRNYRALGTGRRRDRRNRSGAYSRTAELSSIRPLAETPHALISALRHDRRAALLYRANIHLRLSSPPAHVYAGLGHNVEFETLLY